MQEQSMEERLHLLERKVHELQEGHLAVRRRFRLLSDWNSSIWRYLIPASVAYPAVGAIYLYINVPSPWVRAIATVLAITTYAALSNYLQRRWLEHRRSGDQDDM